METQEKKVLIIEDNALIAEGISKAISIENYPIKKKLTDKIKEAINLLNKNKFELIILDLSLPDGNGLEILKMLKEKKSKKKVLVFSTNIHLKRICLKYGAYAFFDKATDFDELINTSKSFLI